MNSLKIKDVKELISKYGGGTSLDTILKKVQGNKVHECPKCLGCGHISVKYNAYPEGLPDSGFVDDWQYKPVTCDLCKGEGYTEKELKPKMVQNGWEEV